MTRKSYALNVCLLVVTLCLPVASIRSMNETRIDIRGSIFAILSPYGFQQCARECENSDYCKAFEFERENLRCMLMWYGGFSTRFSSPVGTFFFSSALMSAYGKYAPGELPSNPICSFGRKLIVTHTGQVKCVQGCAYPPIINGAYTKVVMGAGGGDYTRPGTVVMYDCNNGNLQFIGGPITCLTNGEWANSHTLRGCTVLTNGTCTRNQDCATVPHSVCQDGLCACPQYTTYLKSRTACVTDCRSVYEGGLEDGGEYSVRPNGVNSMEVWCRNGWTIIHRRKYKTIDFLTQSWDNYKNGFGRIHDDYWVGLDNIHFLTQTDNEVLIDLLYGKETFTLRHRKFRIYNESTAYTMAVSKDFTCSHNMTQSFLGLYESNNAAFFTIYDDVWSSVLCASHSGPWWYNENCSTIIKNLNGHFEDMAVVLPVNLTDTQSFSLSKAVIKIRRIEA